MAVRLRGWRTGRFRIQEGNRDPLGFVEPVIVPDPPLPPDLDPDPNAVPFVDPMTRVPRKLQTVPAYEYDNALVNALYTRDNQLECQTSDPQGAVYKSPNLGSTQHYVQFVAVGSDANGPLVCCRLQDADNWVGVRRVGTNVVVVKSVAGVETTLYNVNHFLTSSSVIRMAVEADSFKVIVGIQSAIGTIGAPSLTSTRQGFLARGAYLSPWIDNYEAGLAAPFVADGPDPDPLAVPFTDNFNRGNRALETTTSWTHDGASPGAFVTSSNSLAIVAGVTGPTAYKSPDLGKVNLYVKFRASGSVAASGPYVCVRLGDKTHWVGVQRRGTQAFISANGGSGVTGVFNADYGLTSSSMIELRVTFKYSLLVMSDWTLLIDNVQVATGPLNVTVVSSTRHGLVGRGSATNPWIDDYEAGFLTDPIPDPNPNPLANPFLDDFNRDNRALETVPAWTHDGLELNAAKTVREVLHTSAAAAAGTAYKSPDLLIGHNYVQFTGAGTSGTSLVCTRFLDRLNWLGFRRNGSNLQLIKSVAGVETTLSDTNVSALDTDTFALTAGYEWADRVTTQWGLFKNGNLQASGMTPSPPESTRQGILARGAASAPFIDNYEAGTIAAPPFAPDPHPDPAAHPFVDNFNRNNKHLEASPAWTHDGLILGAATLDNVIMDLGPPSAFFNDLKADTTDAAGSSYKSPDHLSQHHYAQFVAKGNVTSSTMPVVCVRLTDRNNWLGIRRSGSAAVVTSNIGGVVSQQFSGGTVLSTDTLRLEASNVTWVAKVNGIQVGTGIIPTALPATTRAGLVPRGAVIDPWIDNYESEALTFTPGPDPNAAAIPFVDNFDRGNRYLETVPAWTHDGAVVGAAVSFGNRLATNTTTASQYRMPAQTSLIHYAQAKFVTTTVGPVVVVRAPNKDNWLGMSRNGTGIDILQSLAGVVTTVATVVASAMDTDDIRLIAQGNVWVLQKNLVDVGTGAIDASLAANTGIGIVTRLAAVNPWIDDFQGGFISFKDSYNRANENLEANANWTRVEAVVGAAKIISNSVSCDTTNATGALYQSPDCGLANHFVQVVFSGSSPAAAGAYAVCRASSNANWIGIHRDGTSLVVRQTVAGTGTNLSTIATSATSTDVFKFECSGTAWTVRKNGTSIGTGTINAALTSTRTGLVARFHLISPWVDDYESGAL